MAPNALVDSFLPQLENIVRMKGLSNDVAELLIKPSHSTAIGSGMCLSNFRRGVRILGFCGHSDTMLHRNLFRIARGVVREVKIDPPH